MRQIVTKLTVLAVLLTLVAGCAGTKRTMGENRADSSVTAAVKQQLMQDRTADLTQVNVDTRNGTAYLRGEVPTMEDKARAEQLARQVNGVRNVENDLRVTSMSMAPTDRERTEATRTGMTQHPLWAAADNPTCVLIPTTPVELKVYDDYTPPSGTRRTDMQRTAARDRDAVRDRRDRMEEREIARGTEQSTDDRDIARGRSGETVMPRDRINNDPTLAAAVKERLIEEQIADSRDLQVEADGDRVYLDGTVDTPEQKRRAGEIAQRVSGASIIENHLGVHSTGMVGREGVRRIDERGDVIGEPIWSGKLAPGKRQELRSDHGLIRYDYRTSASESFHGDVGAWCNRGHKVMVP